MGVIARTMGIDPAPVDTVVAGVDGFATSKIETVDKAKSHTIASGLAAEAIVGPPRNSATSAAKHRDKIFLFISLLALNIVNSCFYFVSYFHRVKKASKKFHSPERARGSEL